MIFLPFSAHVHLGVVSLLTDYYLWTRAFHIISMTAWMAGLFYLPRLFVYHCRVVPLSPQAELFSLMEKKLYQVIMVPAMWLTLISGCLLAATPGVVNWFRIGFYIKLASVAGLVFFQGKLNLWRYQFQEGKYPGKEVFFRIINEVPTILLITIVIFVTVKPF